MKAGLAFFIFAMRALRGTGYSGPHEVVLLVNPDEETGSKASRAGTEALAKQSHAVLVLEPGTGLEGKAKTARKGIGAWTLKVRGVACACGRRFREGRERRRRTGAADRGHCRFHRSAARHHGKSRRHFRRNAIQRGRGGSIGRNRYSRSPAADARTLERKFRSLKPFDKRCSLELTGGLNRPPMEREQRRRRRYSGRLASWPRNLASSLEESSTGGGSDGNFTAALGVPTLDGMGAVGEGAHAAHESILIDRIADRVALLAKLTAFAH